MQEIIYLSCRTDRSMDALESYVRNLVGHEYGVIGTNCLIVDATLENKLKASGLEFRIGRPQVRQ